MQYGQHFFGSASNFFHQIRVETSPIPPSMHRQSSIQKKRNGKYAMMASSRKDAAQMIRDGKSDAEIQNRTDVSRRVVSRIWVAISCRNENDLSKLLYPGSHHAGRTTVLTKTENEMLKCHLEFAAKRGFAANVSRLRQARRKRDRNLGEWCCWRKQGNSKFCRQRCRG